MERTTEITYPITETESSNDNHKRDGDFQEHNSGVAKKQRAETTLKSSSTTDNTVDKMVRRDSDLCKVSEEESKLNGCLEEGKQNMLETKEFKIDADAAEDKGSRHTMEDAWVVLPDASLDSPGTLRCAHFAIYDGHGGRLAAEYAQKHLHTNVLSAGLPRELKDVKAAKKAILDGFRRTDESLLNKSAAGGWQDGATAVCVWVLGQTVFIANIGDAKAVLARSSEAGGSQNDPDCRSTLKAIVLTREHKAIYPQERARIQKAGGIVSSNGRLQGRLEVSRAFGDRQFKKVGVVATPDIHSFDLTDREHFIILGCDGLWGRLLKEGLTATAVSRRLIREAVIERRCKDNCTAIVIVFKHR
ncbi:probable protein phosphatase 2C 8 isoform X2 [Jatropha curcas]|uniref:probable protein phosphatase 2C 8 isoform X2 n=1 Tax=Jatropha curcas TaxID=180498 RepID=UPI0018941B25|nr:probable protein phosphatase 2C 8 isoform X2 [Jatropha curcas]